MENGTAPRPAGSSPLVRLRPGKYRSDFGTPSAFKQDEGYSDDTRSVVEQDGTQIPEDMLVLPEWILSHNEADRAGRHTFGFVGFPRSMWLTFPPFCQNSPTIS
jgi:F-box and WD-40 domain protein 1/11